MMKVLKHRANTKTTNDLWEPTVNTIFWLSRTYSDVSPMCNTDRSTGDLMTSKDKSNAMAHAFHFSTPTDEGMAGYGVPTCCLGLWPAPARGDPEPRAAPQRAPYWDPPPHCVHRTCRWGMSQFSEMGTLPKLLPGTEQEHFISRTSGEYQYQYDKVFCRIFFLKKLCACSITVAV